MKKTLIIVLTLLVSANAFAVSKGKRGRTQPPTRPVPVIVEREKSEPLRLGFYVSPALKFGEIAGETETMPGIRLGLEFNRSVYVGFAGYGLPDDNYDDFLHDYYFDDDEWAMGYGGIEVGLISGRPRNGQVALGVLIGGGSVNVDENYFDYEYGDYDGFFVIEPQLDVMIGLSQNFRLGFNAGYRFVDDLQSVRYDEEDLEGPTFGISLGIGRF